MIYTHVRGISHLPMIMGVERSGVGDRVLKVSGYFTVVEVSVVEISVVGVSVVEVSVVVGVSVVEEATEVKSSVSIHSSLGIQ